MPERTAQLEGIGFVWNMKNGRKVSTRAQFGLPADERSYENAGRGSGDSTTKPGFPDSAGIFHCPKLPPLQEVADDELSAPPSDLSGKTSYCAELEV